MKQKIYVKKPINIPITGKIGTGKTTVCNLLKKEGFQVFQSDKEIKKIFEKREVNLLIVKIFSKQIKNLLNSEGYINKKALSSYVFSNKKELNKLEQILYPFLEKQKERFKRKNISKKIIFFDVPLLFEKKLHEAYDKIIFLKVNKETQRERVLKRKDMEEIKLKKILLNQRYNLNFFKKFISLEIDSSKTKPQIVKELRLFIKML